MAFERLGSIYIYYHYGEGSGPDVEAHRSDTRTLQRFAAQLANAKIPPNEHARTRALLYMQNLLDTAAVTGGSDEDHRIWIRILNKYLFPHLEIPRR